MAKISVTRALAELKTLDARIERARENGKWIAIQKGKAVAGVNSVDAAIQQIQSGWDSIQSLINRRARIKALIVQSNANTKVTICNQEYSVAEAIELKTSVHQREALLNQMRIAYSNAIHEVEAHNARIEKSIEDAVANLVGGDKSKITVEMMNAIAVPKREQGQAIAIDPLNLKQKIEELQTFVDAVNTELNFTLSEANASTLIDLPD